MRPFASRPGSASRSIRSCMASEERREVRKGGEPSKGVGENQRRAGRDGGGSQEGARSEEVGEDDGKRSTRTRRGGGRSSGTESSGMKGAGDFLRLSQSMPSKKGCARISSS
eukprot:764949-Hanusia_phi.AAC.7